MAEEQEAQGAQQAQGAEPNGEAGAVDYEARYNELLKHSREWERKAKANKAAADELEKLKQSQMSEAEKLQRQYEAEKARADALEAEKLRAEWVSEVSKETGLGADLLSLIAAESKEDLAEKAAGLAGRYGAGGEGQTVPVVLGDGRHAEPPKATANDFFRDQFNKMHR